MATLARQKSLGAFYTPEPIATALVEWAIQSPRDIVLDPSFGGLAFLNAAERRLVELGAEHPASQLYGTDLDPDAFGDAARLRAAGATLLNRDFLLLAPGRRVLPRADAVVGNPPYVRYQAFQSMRERGRTIAARHGVHLTRLASSWAPLLIHASDFVSPGGRLAQVLPAELIHAQYARDVLGYLCRSFERVVVAAFDEHIFTGAQEEVVLLFASGRGTGCAPGVETLSFTNLDSFKVPQERGAVLDPDHEHKLLVGLVEPDAIRVYDELRASDRTRRLGALASVDIGAVTGANAFFVRAAEDVRHLPPEILKPAVSKAAHVAGARFGRHDLDAMDQSGTPARMVVIDADSPHVAGQAVQALVDQGEREGISQRYKCRIRSPWWSLPAAQVSNPPSLFLTYMSSEMARLIINDVGALNTNTLHGVRLHNGADPGALVVGFYSSLTRLSAELVGRSYGGGVLKLEPTEAERLILPRPARHHARLLAEVDVLLRDRQYEQLTSVVDKAILVDDLGMSEADVALLRRGAERLRERRLLRARGSRRRT